MKRLIYYQNPFVHRQKINCKYFDILWIALGNFFSSRSLFEHFTDFVAFYFYSWTEDHEDLLMTSQINQREPDQILDSLWPTVQNIKTLQFTVVEKPRKAANSECSEHQTINQLSNSCWIFCQSINRPIVTVSAGYGSPPEVSLWNERKAALSRWLEVMMDYSDAAGDLENRFRRRLHTHWTVLSHLWSTNQSTASAPSSSKWPLSEELSVKLVFKVKKSRGVKWHHQCL